MCLCTYSSHSRKLCSSSRFAAILMMHGAPLYRRYVASSPLRAARPTVSFARSLARSLDSHGSAGIPDARKNARREPRVSRECPKIEPAALRGVRRKTRNPDAILATPVTEVVIGSQIIWHRDCMRTIDNLINCKMAEAGMLARFTGNRDLTGKRYDLNEQYR